MGGEKTWNGGDQGSRSGWGYWRGSWPAKSTRSNAFSGLRGQGPREEGSEPPSFVEAFQGRLDSTRKTEQRVHSLQGPLTKGQEMSELYLKEMKKALKKEMGRFVARLRADLGQTLQSQEEARAMLLRVAALGGQAPAGDVASMVGSLLDGDVPMHPYAKYKHDRLFDGWLGEGENNDAQSVLRRALESGAGGTLCPRGHQTRRQQWWTWHALLQVSFPQIVLGPLSRVSLWVSAAVKDPYLPTRRWCSRNCLTRTGSYAVAGLCLPPAFPHIVSDLSEFPSSSDLFFAALYTSTH